MVPKQNFNPQSNQNTAIVSLRFCGCQKTNVKPDNQCKNGNCVTQISRLPLSKSMQKQQLFPSDSAAAKPQCETRKPMQKRQ
jgi:hypothetical protein